MVGIVCLHDSKLAACNYNEPSLFAMCLHQAEGRRTVPSRWVIPMPDLPIFAYAFARFCAQNRRKQCGRRLPAQLPPWRKRCRKSFAAKLRRLTGQKQLSCDHRAVSWFPDSHDTIVHVDKMEGIRDNILSGPGRGLCCLLSFVNLPRVSLWKRSVQQ